MTTRAVLRGTSCPNSSPSRESGTELAKNGCPSSAKTPSSRTSISAISAPSCSIARTSAGNTLVIVISVSSKRGGSITCRPSRHSRESGNPGIQHRLLALDARLRGHDEPEESRRYGRYPLYSHDYPGTEAHDARRT